MFRIIQHRRWYYALSLALLVPGLVALALWGLKLGIDFTGGTMIEYANVTGDAAVEALAADVRTFSPSATVEARPDGNVAVRAGVLSGQQRQELAATLNDHVPGARETSFETIGPTIGQELRRRAVTSLVLVLLGILLYVTWAFRRTSQGPVRPSVYGAATIVALLHDVLIVVGVFSLLGHFAGVAVDSLFVTALLTVLGFSVHDTIVVFDRVRERLLTASAPAYEDTVNESLNQTLGRSLATSLTTLFVLLSLWLFGGESIRHFALALLVGIASGTYSSIFVASPLLVSWERFAARR